MRQLKLFSIGIFLAVGLLLQSWPTQANDFQKNSPNPVKRSQTTPATRQTESSKLPVKPPINASKQASSNQVELSEEQNKAALKNWVFLCAPCHTVQGTGTENGPALLGEKARKRFTVLQLKRIFAAPEAHGLSEAVPAFRKLNVKQREELAIWFSKLKKPEDIVVATNSVNPPPFIFVQNCAGCHAPDATGGIGPNLFNVSKRRSKETIIKLIADPRSVGITSTVMPTFEELTEEERTLIADWLLTLAE